MHYTVSIFYPLNRSRLVKTKLIFFKFFQVNLICFVYYEILNSVETLLSMSRQKYSNLRRECTLCELNTDIKDQKAQNIKNAL